VIRFEWDEAKSNSNKIKHKVSFELACHVFDDPLHLSQLERVVAGEERWQTIGQVGGIVLLLVAHTCTETDGGALIRIISARKANTHERKRYEEGAD
jgi:uncharacterized DUF497 family protein